MFKRELRLTRSDYLAYKLRPGLSNIDMTYDRGISLSLGLSEGTSFLISGLNGSGIGPLEQGAFDRDKYKNLMVRVLQEVGESFRIGGFAYFGKEEGVNGTVTGVNSLWMAGPDMSVSLGRVELNVQYVERRDDNPEFLGPLDKKAASRGTFVEIVYTPDSDESRWHGVLLWNWGESDVVLQDYGRKYQTGAVHISYLLRRNLRLTGEYGYDFLNKANSVSVGFVSAF
jgi:hypothetical protein